MTDEFEGSGKVEYLDLPGETAIILSCHRETHRLDRLLKVYHKALALAEVHSIAFRLREGLLRLNDRKGVLTATWRNATFHGNLHGYVRQAWEDCNETEIVHEDMEGRTLPIMRLPNAHDVAPPTTGFQKFGDLLPGVLIAARERMDENQGE
jgi:hypothetical protein